MIFAAILVANLPTLVSGSIPVVFFKKSTPVFSCCPERPSQVFWIISLPSTPASNPAFTASTGRLIISKKSMSTPWSGFKLSAFSRILRLSKEPPNVSGSTPSARSLKSKFSFCFSNALRRFFSEDKEACGFASFKFFGV